MFDLAYGTAVAISVEVLIGCALPHEYCGEMELNMSHELTDIDLLLVDDETDFRESAYQYFSKRGYRVVAVESGPRLWQQRRLSNSMLQSSTFICLIWMACSC